MSMSRSQYFCSTKSVPNLEASQLIMEIVVESYIIGQSKVTKEAGEHQISIEHRNREKKSSGRAGGSGGKSRVSKTPKTESGATVQRRRARDCTRIEASAAIKREGGHFIRESPPDGPGGQPEPPGHPLDPVKETTKKAYSKWG
ncbi:hypothetical protein M9H77_09657 [Catharanthus roseus]|uniref:Uncharacterized protein n=1 Tax=Catharanthus roseus TaxID=4058 RepID=A0ACC0C1D8_CATRO|nr:hypothetical protein M9H77_09657 [Catharanthus roseus]